MKTSPELKSYFAEIGRRGGQRSRRKLSTPEASKMVLVREARRAFKKFRASCFWSYKQDPNISIDHVDFIISCLKKNGGRDAWLTSAKLQSMRTKCL